MKGIKKVNFIFKLYPIGKSSLLFEKSPSFQYAKNNSEVNDSKSVDCSEEEVSVDLTTEVKSAIESLIFYRINMPPSSSIKSILNKLEYIHDNLEQVENEDFYEVFYLNITILVYKGVAAFVEEFLE